MNHIFTPNHVQLLHACYPPTSALLTAGPDYSPKSQELSRLTYYASNHPSKLTKLGSELEKQVKSEVRKARAGNQRTRASLLLSLAVLKALATECRRDIALITPALMSCVEAALTNLPSDLEVAARAASVFTSWTTYTDGHLVGADSSFTKDYLSVLRAFSALCCQEGNDKEMRNKTRLVGFAALSGALNSEALYNDFSQFKAQISVITRPILANIIPSSLETLDRQAEGVKNSSVTPYLAEFRTRPVMERRAASIHLHVDGEKGPAKADVLSACLQALYSLLRHVSANQLSHVMSSVVEGLWELNGWDQVVHCCWISQKAVEWSQYQYRFAVPTKLVEYLLETQNDADAASKHLTIVQMVTTVLSSSTPVINLSTSDIISNLCAIMIRKISVNKEDPLLPTLVECIASLGSHVYYSEQIKDLVSEIVARLVNVELQGVLPRSNELYSITRSEALRNLVTSLLGLIYTADKVETSHARPDQAIRQRSNSSSARPSSPSRDATAKDAGLDERTSSRSKVSPDVWQDTLSLLSDEDYAVRADYAEALQFYIVHEMPRSGEVSSSDGVRKTKRLESPIQQFKTVSALLNTGDATTKFLHAVNAYVYILATAPTLQIGEANRSKHASSLSPPGAVPQLSVQPATPVVEQSAPTMSDPPQSAAASFDKRSFNLSFPQRSRKATRAHLLLEASLDDVPHGAAQLSDIAHLSDIITTVLQELPVRGLLTTVPMLLALDESINALPQEDPEALSKLVYMRLLLTKIWLAVGNVWNCTDLIEISNAALRTAPAWAKLPELPSSELGKHHAPRTPVTFSAYPDNTEPWSGMDSKKALDSLLLNPDILEATSMDAQTLSQKLSSNWTPQQAIQDSFDKSSYTPTTRAEGLSPLLKISPALMQIDNMSLQSLSRGAVGVTDLRDALEGRSPSASSNPGLPAPSISTFDHDRGSLMTGENGLTKIRSRKQSSRKLTITSDPSQMGDVLSRLGIGKQQNGNGSMLKPSFPTSS